MQLSTLKISNLLTFPYMENLTQTKWIKFHNSEEGTINILIWPNGCGKSNLLKIVYIIWKYGIIKEYSSSESSNGEKIKFSWEKKTNKNEESINILSKHYWSEWLPAHVYMSLLMSKHDLNNLCFLNKYSKIINHIISTYTNRDIQFYPVKKEILITHRKIHLYFTIENTHNTIILYRHKLSLELEFIYNYLQYFDLIQYCITIYNQDIRKENEKERYPLHNTFAIISSYSRNNQTTQTPKCIDFFMKKHNSLTTTDKQSEYYFSATDFVTKTNNIIQKYTKIQIKVIEGGIQFFDSDWYVLKYDNLSSGEKSFITLILIIVSHDLEYGMLIIDEPEIHLHPQSQKHIIEFLEEMKREKKIQIIMATHSPSMINENNINSVFRCSKQNNKTKIYSPIQTIEDNDATLLQMLKFDHIAKIFFANTIILVEGETDLYFFIHYLSYLKKQANRDTVIDDYEIITIGGKGGYQRRKDFLSKFGIVWHYIGDRDNIVEHDITSTINMKKYLVDSHKLDNKKSISYNGSKYWNIVSQLKNSKPKQYNKITEKIKNLYNQNIYILSEWDLEAYIDLSSKGLEDTIVFCQHSFSVWLNDKNYDKKRKELEKIIKIVFDNFDNNMSKD